MSLEKEMLAVILKDLPNQTAGVLKSYLEDAEKLQKENTRLEFVLKEKNDLLNNAITNNQKLNQEILILNTKLKSQDDLDSQEKFLKEERRLLDVHILESELLLTRESNEKVLQLCKLIFRNPTFTEETTKSVPMQNTSTGNGYSNTNWINQTETVKITKEQT